MTDPTNPSGPIHPEQPDPRDPTAPSLPTYPPGPPEAPSPPATGQWQASTGQWQAPPADPTTPYAAPVADVGAGGLQPVRHGGAGRKVAAGVAALAVLGAGVFATTQLLADERGAGSPEEAGRQLLDAINQADVLGVIDLLPEGEQQLLLDVTDELADEGRRLGLLGDSFTLDGFPGVTIQVTDPELEVEELSDGLAMVSVVDGEATFELDGDELTGSLGDVVEELADATGTELDVEDVEDSIDIGELVEESEDSGEVVSPFSVAVIEQDGRWFPSVGFTIAEFARGRGEGGAPDLDDGIEARGADDPEAAVQAMLDAATDADPEDAIALLDPGELAALQVYSEVFLGDVEAGGDTGVTVELTDAEVTSLGDGVNRVVPTGFTAEGEVDGGSFSVELADGCVTAQTEAEDEEVDDLDVELCAGDDLADVLPGELGDSFDDLEVPDELTELIEAFEPIEAGIITVERDGEHFVSPLRTVFDLQGALYRGLEREDLEDGGIVFDLITGELDDEFETFFDDLGERFTEQFEAQFEEELPPLDDEFLDEEFDDEFLDEEIPVREPTGASGPNGELLPFDVVDGTVGQDGQATFSLLGTDGEVFIGAQARNGEDLTLTVLDAATGEELGFSDDFNDRDPEVFVSLQEGQVLTVVVEEFFGDPAAFVVYYET